jgi:hypothetical protein
MTVGFVMRTVPRRSSVNHAVTIEITNAAIEMHSEATAFIPAP